MNAPGLRRITGQHYESECGGYTAERATLPTRGGVRFWNVRQGQRFVGRVRALRKARQMIELDKTRRATEILTLGVEVPY